MDVLRHCLPPCNMHHIVLVLPKIKMYALTCLYSDTINVMIYVKNKCRDENQPDCSTFSFCVRPFRFVALDEDVDFCVAGIILFCSYRSNYISDLRCQILSQCPCKSWSILNIIRGRQILRPFFSPTPPIVLLEPRY